MPASKMPATVNARMRGRMPTGVTVPCARSSTTRPPTPTPRVSAAPLPSTMRNAPGSSASKLPAVTSSPSLDTVGSSSGSMPRITSPTGVPPAAGSSTNAMPRSSMNGAAPATSPRASARARNACHSSSLPSNACIDACEATPRILRCSSYSKPSITDVTTISTATPMPMPSIETHEMNEIKLSPRRARRYRSATESSYGCLNPRLRPSFVTQRVGRRDRRGTPGGIDRREHGQRECDDRDQRDVERVHLGRHFRHVVHVAREDLEPERALEPRHDHVDVERERETERGADQGPGETDHRALHEENARDPRGFEAARAQDRDVALLLRHDHHQRRDDVEGRNGDDEHQDDRHHRLLDADRGEIARVLLDRKSTRL